MSCMEQGYTTPAPSTSTGNAATILGAYRHCHTLKMINEEIFFAASGHCLSIWNTLPEGLKTLYLFWFELPCLQMSLTGNRPPLLVDKPQVLRLKQAKPCWVKKFSGLETFRIIENQDFLFLFSITLIIHPNVRALSNTSELIASIWQVLMSSYSFRLSL